MLEGGPKNAGVANYQKAKWIEVMALSDPMDPLLTTSLDVGEAAVIGLALELDSSVVLIDEGKARKIARTVLRAKLHRLCWSSCQSQGAWVVG